MALAIISSALTVAFYTALAIALAWLALRWAWRMIQARRGTWIEIETQDCGDQGGVPADVCRRTEVKVFRPKAPETGSGRPVGEGLPEFLKRTPGDQTALRKKYDGNAIG